MQIFGVIPLVKLRKTTLKQQLNGEKKKKEIKKEEKKKKNKMRVSELTYPAFRNLHQLGGIDTVAVPHSATALHQQSADKGFHACLLPGSGWAGRCGDGMWVGGGGRGSRVGVGMGRGVGI